MKLGMLVTLGLLLSASYGGGDIAQTVESKIEVPYQNIQVAQEKEFFVYMAGGIAVLDIDSSLAFGAAFTDGALDDKGAVAEVGMGYRYSENIFATVAAQRTILDIADIDNFYASVNYRFSDVAAKPYIGVFLGYSRLKWSEAPAAVTANKDLVSEGLMYGLQAGVEQELTENWSLFAKYQFIKYDHLMDIKDGVSTIEHKYGQNILTGVRYEF